MKGMGEATERDLIAFTSRIATDGVRLFCLLSKWWLKADCWVLPPHCQDRLPAVRRDSRPCFLLAAENRVPGTGILEEESVRRSGVKCSGSIT